MKELLANRIREKRERAGLSQTQLAEKVGWAGHQTIQQIEAGVRELKAWELVKVASALEVSLYDLLPNEEKSTGEESVTKPYILWREKPQQALQVESAFLKRCEDFCLVETLVETGFSTSWQLPHFKIELEDLSYEKVTDLAEETRRHLDLGAFPARTLVHALENRFNVKFFVLDTEGHGSAASYRGDSGDCILVASSEPAWRQNFSIAHELFHLITWDEKLFASLEEDEELRELNEKFANAFAAALLMPGESVRAELRKLCGEGWIKHATLVALAQQFEVSMAALLWRLHDLRYFSRSEVEKHLKDVTLIALDRHNRFAQTKTENSPVRALGSKFARTAYLAYSYGKISRSRLARMLSVSLPELANRLEQLGLSEVSDDEIKINYS